MFKVWQLSRKASKRIKIVSTIAIVGTILWYLPVLFFQFEFGRKGGANYLAEQLSESLNTEVQCKTFEMTFSGDIKANELIVKDSLSRELLSANSIVLDLKLSTLWHFVKSKKLELDHIRLFAPKISLREDSLGQLNISHIIRHLQANKNKETKEGLNLSVDNLLLRDGVFNYYRQDSLIFGLEDLEAKVYDINLGKEGEQQVAVRELSFDLSNGFRVKNFTSNFEFKENTIKLEDLDLLFGESQVNIPTVKLNLNSFAFAKIDSVRIAHINVALSDLRPFDKRFARFGNERLRGHLQLWSQGLALNTRDFELSVTKLFNLSIPKAKAEFTKYGDIFSAEAKTLELALGRRVWEDLKALNKDKNKEQLVNDLSLLGACSFSGDVELKKGDDIQAQNCKLKTDVGDFSFDGKAMFVDNKLLNLGTNIKGAKISLNQFREQDLALQIPKLDLNLNLDRTKLSEPYKLSANVLIPNFEFRGKSYENLELKGTGYKDYQMMLGLKDRLVQLSSKLKFSYTKAGLRNINLAYEGANINPTDWLPKSVKTERRYDLKGTVSMDRLSENFTKLNFILEELAWQNLDDKENGRLDAINLKLNRDKQGLHTSLDSHWARGTFYTNVPFEDLLIELRHYFYRRTPIIAHWANGRHQQKKVLADLELHIDSVPEELHHLVKLPINQARELKLKASFNKGDDELSFVAQADLLSIGKHHFDSLNLQYAKGELKAQSDIYLANSAELIGAELELSQKNNDFSFSLDLGLDREQHHYGELYSTLQLSSPMDLPKRFDELNLLLGLRPSKLRIHHENWELSPSEILLSKSGGYIKGLELRNKKRCLAIDGALSQNPQDSLHLRLERMSLLYILEASGVKFNLLDADLSGDLYAKFQDKTLYAFGDVRSDTFLVDAYNAGASDLHLDWDSKSGFLAINGDLGELGGCYTKANGGISIGRDSGIDILFTANQLNIGFVQAFTDSFLSKLRGQATGKIRLFGLFRDGVTIEGNAQVKDAVVGVKSLGTTYRFNDSLRFDADRMIFSNIKLLDERGHTALFDGSIRHRNFSDMNIDLNFQKMDAFKVLENQNVRRIPILGQAYCTGGASLTGDKAKLLLKLNGKMTTPSNLSVDINALNTIWKDKSLMRFISIRDTLAKTKRIAEVDVKKHSQNLLDLKLDLDIDSETALGIRLGNNRSDEIKARGEGHLQINVPFIGDQTIYGDFKLLSGDYSLRLENLTNKKFKLQKGSMLNFRGNPAQANINIAAIYSLTANISDLDEGLAFGTRRTNMPVNCILGLTGSLSRPKIGFSINLPKASGEVERRLKSLLSTDEAMTKQALSLISLGKFMPSAYGKNTNEGTNNWSALASTTISEQLSALLGDLSEKVQLGTNIKTSNQYFTDTEVELLFSGQLFNNRLLISGNVGYHDNPFLSSTYIGEFDLEYKLNKSGNLRLKAYNHYNNSYQYIRKGLTTQGFGLLFRKRFDKLSDLFKSRKKKEKVK